MAFANKRVLLSAAAAVCLIAHAPVSAETALTCPSSSGKRVGHRLEQANKRLVRRFHDAINRQDWAAADALVGAGYRHHVTGEQGFRVLTWDTFKRGNQHLRSAFPDWSNIIVQAIAEGDKVAVVLEGSGTHKGSIAGEPPTGRTAKLPIIVIHQICGGKLVADWEGADAGPLMAALKRPD